MAIFLARHGQRHDYEQKEHGVNWTATAERPWDPPLTPIGEQQGTLLGAGARAQAEKLVLPPITRVISSPFIRCLQTSVAAAEALGVTKIAVEPGLAEVWQAVICTTPCLHTPALSRDVSLYSRLPWSCPPRRW